MIGKTILHYNILEKLGEGGMGVVYKAEDTRLQRTVAIKFLPQDLTRNADAKQRFIHEARTASALDHPNICTIHEINETEDGQLFIVMAYYDDESLKQKIEQAPLNSAKAIDIALQVAEGLKKAHSRGIIHRDIKPSNIMFTSDGIVKIVDFGLAKLTRGQRLTVDGKTMGTIAYMSPEQTRGDDVDQRSDIWSLGVVMYEMLIGELPFKGDHDQAVIYSIVNEEPEILINFRSDVPMELEQIVWKTLAKYPEERYQDFGDILMELKMLKREIEIMGWKQLPFKPKYQPSIAVLPFQDLSLQKDQEYLCDGIAEEIINTLTHIESLHVVARTSAFVFKDKKEDIREIGKKLKVDTLLEGSVRKAGDRLRITAQLINAKNGYHIWSERYDREMKDIFAIQDEISLEIANKLRIQLIGEEKVAIINRYTENVEAYKLYLKGRYFLNKRSSDGFKKSMDYFRQALEKDPLYAKAYVGIADNYILLGYWDLFPPKDSFPKAKAAAEKALEINDKLAEAHASLAVATLGFDWDWSDSKRQFKRSIELNSNYAIAHQWYALYLTVTGQHEEAISEIKRAQELDPFSLIINTHVGWFYYFARQYDQAIEQLLNTIEMDIGFSFAYTVLGFAYLQKIMFKQAFEAFKKALDLTGDDPFAILGLGITYVRSGKKRKAAILLDELKKLSIKKYVPPFYISALYVCLGNYDKAFEWLNKVYEERSCWMIFLKVFPELDIIRSDQRFTDLLKKMDLENG